MPLRARAIEQQCWLLAAAQCSSHETAAAPMVIAWCSTLGPVVPDLGEALP